METVGHGGVGLGRELVVTGLMVVHGFKTKWEEGADGAARKGEFC